MSIYTIPGREFRAVMSAAAKDSVRYYLNGFLIDPESEMVATNGCILLRHPLELAEGSDPITEQVILAVEGNALPVAVETVTIDTETLRLTGTTSRGQEHVRALTVIDGKFPDYRKVVPDTDNAVAIDSIAWNPELLAGAQKAMNKDTLTPVRMRFTGHGLSPIALEWPGTDLTGVVMPCRA